LQNPVAGSFYSSISTTTDEGNASYNAMFVSVNHRLSQNFTLIANYTWSHCIDLGDFWRRAFQQPFNLEPQQLLDDVGNLLV